jgi:hypothetical protein
MALMGIREYGRHRGVSHVAVLKALRTGRIRQGSDGLIDADAADRDWARNTHPAPRAPRAMPMVSTGDAGYARARAIRAHFEALSLKHEYERRSAELLNANEVKIASYRIGQVFREHMHRFPDGVVGRLLAHVREHGAAPGERAVHAIVASEVRAALQAFADEMTAGSSS